MGAHTEETEIHVPEMVRREAVFEFLEKINVDPREVTSIHVYPDRVELVRSMFIKS